MFKKKKVQRIFDRHVTHVLVLPDRRLIGLTSEPKKIPGGYLSKHGRRYVGNPQRSFNRIKLIPNDVDFL